MAKVIEAETPQAAWATMSWRALANVFLIGSCIGLLTHAVYLLLSQFVFEPILCRDAIALASCDTTNTFATIIATIIGSTVGLIFLVRERIFRPLLVILGVAFALWGIFGALVVLPWIAAIVVAAVIFGIAYGLFTWLAQTNNLIVALTTVIVAAALARLVLAS